MQIARLITPLILIFLFQACQNKTQETAITTDTFTYIHGDNTYNFSAWSEEIIKVNFSDSLTSRAETIAPLDDRKINFTLIETDSIITISTQKTSVVISLQEFSITFRDNEGNIKTQLTGDIHRNADTIIYQFSLKENESIYGTGSRALPLNRRGHAFMCYNMPRYGYGWGEATLNFNLPHLLSSEKYMLFFDNPAKSYFDIGKTVEDRMTYKAVGGNQTFYFISGSDHKELSRLLTLISGRQPIPPLWALGNLQSRFGYRSQAEAEQILEQSLEAGYPTDAIILDLYWFGSELEDGRMGELSWDMEKWPDPEAMIQRFKERGIKTVLVTEPFFTKKSQHFDYLSENNLLVKDSLGDTYVIDYFYFGPGGLLDIFKPKAQEWMWSQYKELKKIGIDGWWVDLGEPEQHPSEMIHVNGKADEVHGMFGHRWAQMLSEGFRSDFPEERLFHLARAGFVGSQRYGMIPWSGDVGRNWSGLQAQPSIMLSMGLSGFGYMHSDAGGFTIDKRDDELYTRWLQFATFTPIFRPHADEIIPAEPVLWPDIVQARVKPLIELRYRMLPYIYTLSWENSRTGMPLARPMFYEFEEVSDTLHNQYMWGSHILVAPILEKGLKTIKVYLPKGFWYDFYTEKVYRGGKWIEVETEEDKLPIFIREGAIIPLAKLASNTQEYSTDTLEYTYYYSENPSENKFYFDDGAKVDAYIDGDYQLVIMKSSIESRALRLDIYKEGSEHPDYGNKVARLRLVGDIKEIKKIKVNGQAVDVEADKDWMEFTIQE